MIPVIDLMGGQVVRGVGGRRNEYRPIESKLAVDARPITVGQALADHGFRAAYVADLDAIAGAEPNWTVYRSLLDCGLTLDVDAGLSTVEQARTLAGFNVGGPRLAGIIAGLESLPDPRTLAAICHVIGPERLIFSLDLKAGAPLVSSAAWQRLDARQIAAIALRAGVRRMIVLDLATVGMGGGSQTEPLCRDLKCLEPGLEVIAGGGVRGTRDLHALAAAGCDAALVATALHDGRLSPADCVSMR